ncbi:hypothetical protein Tco_0716865 [Tanacetum coccineum]
MNDFECSSFHDNMGRRLMTSEQEELINWDDFNEGDIEICKAFLKLSLVEDPIWEKISCNLVNFSRDVHVDDCIYFQVQHMTEENVQEHREEISTKIHLFDLTKRGRRKAKRAKAYGVENKLLALGEDKVQASPNYKAKIKMQAISMAFFIFAMFVILI